MAAGLGKTTTVPAGGRVSSFGLQRVFPGLRWASAHPRRAPHRSGEGLWGAPPTPGESIFRALEIGKEAGLRYLYAGNLPAGDYENTRCHACGATVIERVGFSANTSGLDGTKCAACGEELPIVR